MGSLLVLYLNSGQLLPGRFELLYGASAVAALFGTPAGDSDATQALSSQLWGAYVCLAYVTPIAGGVVADAVLGPRATLLCGGCLMALGHGCMMSESLFLVGLVLVALGNGGFKPSVSAQARRPPTRTPSVARSSARPARTHTHTHARTHTHRACTHPSIHLPTHPHARLR